MSDSIKCPECRRLLFIEQAVICDCGYEGNTKDIKELLEREK